MSFARVTSKYLVDTTMNNLRINLTRLNDLQTRLSSGKNINVASDDPVGLSRLMNIDESRQKDQRFISNIDAAVSELNTTDSLLSSTTDIIQRARELTIQASNQTNGPDELSAIRQEIQQLLNQVVQVGNTKYGNKYLFGGIATSTPPFNISNPTTNDIRYQGTFEAEPYQRQIEIGVSDVITVNFPGHTVFGNNDLSGAALPGGAPNQDGLITTLAGLVTDLDTAIATPTTANYDQIRTRIDDLDADLDNVLSYQTQVGALTNRLELTRNRLEDRQIALSSEYGSIQDVDLAATVSDLNFQESVFQTSLATSARVLQPTLLNYL